MRTATWTVLNGCYVKGSLNVRLRFGEPGYVRRFDNGLTHYGFAPGQRFALMWARLSPRRQVAGFAVAEALELGRPGYHLPCIRPAVQVHAFLSCRCIGKDRGSVGRIDDLIRAIQQADIDPCIVPPVYYRLASQAIRVGREARRIDRTQLLCFLEDQHHEN
jgi:hypothetical protein